MALFGNGHSKFWIALTAIGFMAGGSCASLHSRLTVHEDQSTVIIKRLTTMCQHQANTLGKIKECIE